MALYDPVWSQIDPYGPIWSSLVWYGPLRSRMVPYGSVWPLMVPYGPLWSGHSSAQACFLYYQTKMKLVRINFSNMFLFEVSFYKIEFLSLFLNPLSYKG